MKKYITDTIDRGGVKENEIEASSFDDAVRQAASSFDQAIIMNIRLKSPADGYLEWLDESDTHEFGKSVLKYMYVTDGTIDDDQEISGGDFVEHCISQADHEGLTPAHFNSTHEKK